MRREHWFGFLVLPAPLPASSNWYSRHSMRLHCGAKVKTAQARVPVPLKPGMEWHSGREAKAARLKDEAAAT